MDELRKEIKNELKPSLDHWRWMLSNLASEDDKIRKLNLKTTNLLENRFPELPESSVFFDREKHFDKWSEFKNKVSHYQLNYDDGTEYAKLKMRKISKFLSENYHGMEIKGIKEVKNLLKDSFSHAITPDNLTIGKKYDVAVIYLDKLSKLIEINIHHAHTIKNVRFLKSENTYVVTTVEGLQGTTLMDQVDEVETLCFDNMGSVDKIISYLHIKIQPEIEGWKLSVINDNDEFNNINESTEPSDDNLSDIKRLSGL